MAEPGWVEALIRILGTGGAGQEQGPRTIQDYVFPSHEMMTNSVTPPIGADPVPKPHIGDLGANPTALNNANFPWWAPAVLGALGGVRLRSRAPQDQDNRQSVGGPNVSTRPIYQGDDMLDVNFRNVAGSPQVEPNRLAFWARQYGAGEDATPNVRPYSFDVAEEGSNTSGRRPMVPANRTQDEEYNLALANQVLGTSHRGETSQRAINFQRAKQDLDKVRDALTEESNKLMQKPQEQWTDYDYSLASALVNRFEQLDAAYQTMQNAVAVRSGTHRPHTGPHSYEPENMEMGEALLMGRGYTTGHESGFERRRKLESRALQDGRRNRPNPVNRNIQPPSMPVTEENLIPMMDRHGLSLSGYSGDPSRTRYYTFADRQGFLPLQIRGASGGLENVLNPRHTVRIPAEGDNHPAPWRNIIANRGHAASARMNRYYDTAYDHGMIPNSRGELTMPDRRLALDRFGRTLGDIRNLEGEIVRRHFSRWRRPSRANPERRERLSPDQLSFIRELMGE